MKAAMQTHIATHLVILLLNLQRLKGRTRPRFSGWEISAFELEETIDMAQYVSSSVDAMPKTISFSLYAVFLNRGGSPYQVYSCILRLATDKWFYFESGLGFPILRSQVLDEYGGNEIQRSYSAVQRQRDICAAKRFTAMHMPIYIRNMSGKHLAWVSSILPTRWPIYS
ncbi:hypothetical protein DL89DRAFT_11977 [Linderina pennispora]|uniref:USP domain-containing protein n=1 Tax=Linderina pennispora TaxID=61395 RepID=A0A1Y1WKW3_9FUNG|nr:uncharacterized protein DL89DRAFT_11977 [Linderina pennispora]ORX74221.1 hypothetical protein DL89DRAFT_11977 [Linderina pennispora]